MDFSEKFFLNQYIEEPTRLNNILDLFFTNNEDIILKIQVEAPTTMSDHKLQCITTCFISEVTEEHIQQDDKSLQSLNFSDNTID